MKNWIIICLFLYSLSLWGQDSFSSSNLPIVVINTSGASITDGSKITAGMKIIFTGDGERNCIGDTVYNYDGFIGIKLRGNSSLSFNQKQYTLETRDAEGENLNVSLLGLPEENDWVLNAPYNDVSMQRNVLAYHLWNAMGHWGPHTRWVEVVLNGNYQGVYVLTETIKRDKNRIAISKMDPSDTTMLKLTGGYIMRIDASDSDDLTFQSKVQGVGTTFSRTVTWMYQYPDPDDIQPAQQAYIHNYIDTVELIIQSDTFDDPVIGYSKYIDVESFVDYFIHTEVSLNADGFKRSAYFYKERKSTDGTGGKLFAGSVWDYNLAYGNCNFCNANNVNAWVYEGCETNPTPSMWKRLTGDSAFMNEVKCRYLELRKGILSESYLNGFIDENAACLEEAQGRHFAQWNELLGDNSSSWGGGFWGGGVLWYSAYQVANYSEEIDTLKGWLAERLRFLDKNLGGSCTTLSNTTVSESDQLVVYPNPFSRHLMVESNITLVSCTVYDMNGGKVADIDIPGLTCWETSDFEMLPDGLYLFLFRTDNGVQITWKMRKQ